jgi:hypothetical protein
MRLTGTMLAGMVSDKLVYRAADRIISLFGKDALGEVNRLICDAIGHKDRDQALLMVRIRLAILLLQAPPSQMSH